MNFKQAVISGFRHYYSTDDRAPRSEYWYWQLFTLIAGLPFDVVDAMYFHNTIGVFGLSFSLVTFLPGMFVLVRRLHDVNRSGYWWMISLTVIGLIPLFYWMVKKGTAGENRFGADPLTVQQA